MKVVILCGGLGTRLYPLTVHFPKFLVTIGNKTALEKQVNFWNNYSVGEKTIYIHINEKFEIITRAYVDNLAKQYPEVEFKISTENESINSLVSIHKLQTNYPELIGQSVYLNWSDIIPSYIQNPLGLTNVIYTNGSSNRYQADDNYKSIIEYSETGGNVCGLFFLKNFQNASMAKYSGLRDFVETLDGVSFQNMPCSITDFGDRSKLSSLYNVSNNSRHFNDVIILDKNVHKKALTDHARKLQDKEETWYKIVGDKPFVPKLIDRIDDTLILEKVRSSPLKSQYKPGDYVRVMNTLKELHGNSKVAPKVEAARDLKREAYTKTHDRIDSIKEYLVPFSGVKFVNGVEIQDHETVINRLYEELVLRSSNQYSIIHGDPNFSNVMYDRQNDKMILIDPRGYFGETTTYGPIDYDYAKLMYALSGYDNFTSNQDHGILIRNETDMEFHIPVLERNFHRLPIFNRVHRLWLPIIWLSLSGYLKHDPIRAVQAYYHGLWLAEIVASDDDYRISLTGEAFKENKSAKSFGLTTKCPSKWRLTDLETGQVYQPNQEGGEHVWKIS